MTDHNSQSQKTDFSMGSLDPDLPMPLYHQLYIAIKQQITTGALPTGSKMPSEIQLAAHLDISRITVKRALNELALAGFVSRARGRGTIVTANTGLKFKGGANDYIKNVAKLRSTTQARILERQIVTAPDSVALNLKLSQGTQVEKIVHSLASDDTTISYVKTYVPCGLTDAFSDKDLRREPLLTLFIQAGVRIKRAEQKITAVGAPGETLASLEVKKGDPLLFIECVMIDDTGRPVEDISAWYHPERYQYQMTLTEMS